MGTSNKPEDKQPFPTFGSLVEAEAYSDKTGDAYFEICYHLEGKLNLCLKAIHDLYTNAPTTKRPKMQTGVVRQIICPEGWPKHPKTLVCTLLACARFRHEETCHAYTVKEAMAAFVLEKEHDGTLRDSAFDSRTFEPLTPADAKNARGDLLRLCDWIESRLHCGTHTMWYRAPDCFSDDPDKVHLANIGITQRHLAKLPERDRKRWEGIHGRAAEKHQEDEAAWLGACMQIPRAALLALIRRGFSNEALAALFGASEDMVVFRRNMTGIDHQLRRAKRFTRIVAKWQAVVAGS